MRVVFVHQGRENVGVEVLSALLKQEGHEVALAYDQGLFGPNDNVFYSPRLERWFENRDRLIEEICSLKADLVGFSAYTNTYPWAAETARRLKSRQTVPIVFGGIHPTLVPDRVMENEAIDYVLVGEGESAVPELCACVEAGREPAGVANVWYRSDGTVVSQPPRPPAADLDSLPFPDKRLFERYVNFRDDYLVLTTRGCMQNCSYCCESFLNRLYQGRYFRRRTPQNVLVELRQMHRRYRFREVMFNDAIFFTDREWLGELLRDFHRDIGVPFRCFGQVQYLDEEIAELLVESGCYAVEFGVQTLNEGTRKRILHRPETNEQNRRAFEICDRFGLSYDVDHMFGLPHETADDAIEAARFYALFRRLNRIKCHNLVYFPRLAITDLSLEEGLLSDEDISQIEAGRVNDFFHRDDIRSPLLKRDKQAFVKLFKILPLLGPRGTEFFLRRGRIRWLRFAPGAAVVALQVLVALKNRDYRFLLYFRYYPLRIRRALAARRRCRAFH